MHATSSLVTRDLLATGSVVVRQVPLPFDERLRAHALLLAERLVDLDSPLLVRILEVRPTSDGLDLVLEQPDAARPLLDLVEDGDLAPGQVVTLGVDLAESLAALHDRGLTHGRLRTGDVLVGVDGAVLLTGYGVTAVLGSAGRPADDVRDLVALLADLGPGSPAGWMRPVRDAVEAGEHDARAVGALMAAAGPRPQPLPGASPPGLPVPRPPGARHRAASGPRGWVGALPSRGLRTLALLVPAVLGILLLAGWVGATSSTQPEPEASAPGPAPARAGADERAAAPPQLSPTPPPQPTTQPQPAPDWRAVLTQLDVTRAGILAAPDEGRLAEVDAPGSSAYADDLAAVRALTGRHAVARGVRFDLQSVRVRSAGEWRTDLEVVDALRPHTIVATSGESVLERRPARAARTSVVTLVRTEAGWRIAQVLPA